MPKYKVDPRLSPYKTQAQQVVQPYQRAPKYLRQAPDVTIMPTLIARANDYAKSQIGAEAFKKAYGDTLTPIDLTAPEFNDPMRILKNQFLNSSLGKRLTPDVGMLEKQDLARRYNKELEAGTRGVPGVAPVPPKTAGTVSTGESGVPMSEHQIRHQVGQQLHQTLAKLMEGGLTHKEAQRALSSSLQSGKPTLTPDDVAQYNPDVRLNMVMNSPQFQASAKIQGEILPPLYQELDTKKQLLNQLVGWEDAGRPRKQNPLYGWSSILARPYNQYSSGDLAAEIMQDEGTLEERAITNYLSQFQKKESMQQKISNLLATGQAPGSDYFQQQGVDFPELSSVVLATLMPGASTHKPTQGGMLSPEQRQAALRRWLG